MTQSTDPNEAPGKQHRYPTRSATRTAKESDVPHPQRDSPEPDLQKLSKFTPADDEHRLDINAAIAREITMLPCPEDGEKAALREKVTLLDLARSEVMASSPIYRGRISY